MTCALALYNFFYEKNYDSSFQIVWYCKIISWHMTKDVLFIIFDSLDVNDDIPLKHCIYETHFEFKIYRKTFHFQLKKNVGQTTFWNRKVPQIDSSNGLKPSESFNKNFIFVNKSTKWTKKKEKKIYVNNKSLNE